MMGVSGIVDVHAHVIPGIDDGARTVEEASLMIRQAYAQGITAVVATPHYSRRHSSLEGTERLRRLADEVRQALCQMELDVSLYLGQELFYHESLIEALKEGRALTISDSAYVLVEFEPSVAYEGLYRGIRALFSAGYKPILAHMERYQCLRQEEHLTDFIRSGCLLQMNYESLQGSRFRSGVRWCRRQVLAGRIHMLGTDMHRLDFRPPDITEALDWLERHVEEELIEDMTRNYALHFLIGKDR